MENIRNLVTLGLAFLVLCVTGHAVAKEESSSQETLARLSEAIASSNCDRPLLKTQFSKTEVLKVQNHLASLGKPVGTTGCDGILGRFSLHSLSPNICPKPANYETDSNLKDCNTSQPSPKKPSRPTTADTTTVQTPETRAYDDAYTPASSPRVEYRWLPADLEFAQQLLDLIPIPTAKASANKDVDQPTPNPLSMLANPLAEIGNITFSQLNAALRATLDDNTERRAFILRFQMLQEAIREIPASKAPTTLRHLLTGNDATATEDAPSIMTEQMLQIVTHVQDLSFPTEGLMRTSVESLANFMDSVATQYTTPSARSEMLKRSSFDPQALGLPKVIESGHLTKLADSIRSQLATILALSYKRQSRVENKIDFDQDDCDCSRGRREGEVYGVVPFWEFSEIAAEQSESEGDGESEPENDKRKLGFDYSIYDRLEVFAGTLNLSAKSDTALVINSATNASRNRRKLGEEATQYLNKRDLLLKLNAEGSPAQFNAQLTAEKVELERKYNDYDGVTLWLPSVSDQTLLSFASGEDWQQSVEPVACTISGAPNLSAPPELQAIGQLIGALRNQSSPTPFEPSPDLSQFEVNEEAQRAESERTRLNLLITGSLKEVFFYVDYLENCLKRNLGGKPTMVDRVLYYVEEPASQSKTALRQWLEQRFTGYTRPIVLRKFIPLIVSRPTFPGIGAQDFVDDEVLDQLYADLVYYQDNLGGVGTWGLVANSEPDTETEPTSTAVTMAALIGWVFEPAQVKQSKYCFGFCEHRHTFGFLFIGVPSILLLIYVAQLLSCTVHDKLGPKWRQTLGWLTSLSLALATWFLWCIPNWSPWAWFTILLLFAGLVLAAIRRSSWRRDP